MPFAIVCDALTRDFGKVRAVDGLSLSVPEGSIFAFLGPNGVGKTTTIHLLLGILEPTSGSARVLGFDPVRDGRSIRRSSGALLEHPGLYERLTAEQNLRFYARIAHLTREETDERIAELLTRFGLYERRNDVTGTWSRGMKQKLAIARALLHRPSLVFLDEPTAGLDPEATVALRRDIRSLRTTVFLTTHNLADVEKMATHVAVIRGGQLLEFGTPAELRARAMRSHVTIRMRDREPLALELAGDESVAPVVTRLVHDGAQIEEVRREEPSLEDVFLQLVKRPAEARSTAQTVTATDSLGPQPLALSPVFPDILTIMRKEWSEMLSAAETGVSRRTATIAGIALLAIAAAFAASAGETLVQSPVTMSVSMVAFLIVLAYVADSFAGERERHTLETLVASAIPDEALVLGKISAAVAYGWCAMMILMMVLLAGANFTAPGSMYPLTSLAVAFLLVPLALLLFSVCGVWISLISPTVKAAQARVSVLFLGVIVGMVLLQKFLPRDSLRQAAVLMKSETGRMQMLLGQTIFLAALDLILVAFAMVRFRRSRMI
ncbi:MAG TPA: ATP-binding cassette domain-containing protein [Thermoanaerobaculia bacterium]|nr:ATP-binding cassette domain-containing protein [Thermoanaerobaculia bacterium]